MNAPAIFQKIFQLFNWGNCDRGQRSHAHPQWKKNHLDQLGNRRAEWRQREENAEWRNPCFWWAKMRSSDALLHVMLCHLSLREDSPRRDITDLQTLGEAAAFPAVSLFLFMGLGLPGVWESGTGWLLFCMQQWGLFQHPKARQQGDLSWKVHSSCPDYKGWEGILSHQGGQRTC